MRSNGCSRVEHKIHATCKEESPIQITCLSINFSRNFHERSQIKVDFLIFFYSLGRFLRYPTLTLAAALSVGFRLSVKHGPFANKRPPIRLFVFASEHVSWRSLSFPAFKSADSTYLEFFLKILLHCITVDSRQWVNDLFFFRLDLFSFLSLSFLIDIFCAPSCFSVDLYEIFKASIQPVLRLAVV